MTQEITFWVLAVTAVLGALVAVQRRNLIHGVFALLVLAAFIEAFWSSRELAPQIKYGVGAACWALLALYLLFAGRRQGGRHGPE